MSEAKLMSKRQVLHDDCRLGLFLNQVSGRVFYARTNGQEKNRIIPDSVSVDENGVITVSIDINNIRYAEPIPFPLRPDIDKRISTTAEQESE